jgi:HK97 family phage portal protein
VDDFKKAFGGAKRFNAMLVPKGIEVRDPITVENDKAQFNESRKLQRTVIAGALGVPPHLVGDLDRATFNNVEQQDKDFTLNVIMPVVKSFESAFERDLLTEKDREDGIIIRFNMDSTLRADFKSRQEGLKIQREMGVINPDEWRELEGKNPRPDDGGEEYWDQGPSGQGQTNDQT